MARRDDYGRILPTHRWQGVPRRRRWWRALRWWLLAALLVGLVFLIDAWWQVPAPQPKGTPQRVASEFRRCGTARGPNCVVDGDTFIMATRHFRITGIDAPEIGIKARCAREAGLAEEAAVELLHLLKQGPFIMRPPTDGLRDDYGRELVHVTRQRPDGSVQDIAADLVASGKVRRYEFGARGSWC